MSRPPGMAPKERGALMELTARNRAPRATSACCSPSMTWTPSSPMPTDILVLVRGEIIARGRPDEVRGNARVKQVYLGDIGVAAAMRARRAG
jgi:branched-chain amino acid transport system ATP-binding protein